MSWNTSTIGLKICLICMLLATVLFVLGFATNDWMTSTYDLSAWGLWKVTGCVRGTCSTAKITAIALGHMEFWFRLVQIFECIGLICLCIALFVVLIMVFLQTVRNRIYLKVVIYCSFGGDFEILYDLTSYFMIDFEGALWMRYNREWGLICPDDWANTAVHNANVACNSVGFNSGGQLVLNMPSVPPPGIAYHLFDTWCEGTERHLAQCPHEDVNGKVCSGYPLYIRCNKN